MSMQFGDLKYFMEMPLEELRITMEEVAKIVKRKRIQARNKNRG